jgi:hypothetical protein
VFLRAEVTGLKISPPPPHYHIITQAKSAHKITRGIPAYDITGVLHESLGDGACIIVSTFPNLLKITFM